MMREILFRAKRSDTGEWIYGTPFQEYSDFWGEWEWKIQTKHPLTNVPYMHLNVDQKIISQFTGLTDKNGKKIFEGDIVTIPGTKKMGLPAPVWYDCNGAIFLVRRTGFNPLNLWDATETYEVIGNIHDNPELLGTT